MTTLWLRTPYTSTSNFNIQIVFLVSRDVEIQDVQEIEVNVMQIEIDPAMID